MVNLHLDEDEKLPEDEMAQLLAEAGPMLSLCVTGIRAFFRQRHKPSRRKTAGRKKTPASLIGSARRGAAKLAS